jgi:hypothetical protein
MTTLKRVILNSVTLYPSSIDVDEIRITLDGSPYRMLGGNLRMYHVGFKKKWTLHWTNLPETSIAAIRALYRTTSSITYNDEDNANYTVVTTEFSTNLSADNISLAGIIYYNVDLGLEEV